MTLPIRRQATRQRYSDTVSPQGVAYRATVGDVRTVLSFAQHHDPARGGTLRRAQHGGLVGMACDRLVAAQVVPALSWASPPSSRRPPHRNRKPRWPPGENHQNTVDARLTDWWSAYYGENHPCLARVQRPYDPAGFLRFPQTAGT